MNNNNGNTSQAAGVEKLVAYNYSYWKLCIEAYLQGQDLWDMVAGDEKVIPDDTPQNGEPRRKWKIKCGKALFALRMSVSKDYIEHVRDSKTPYQMWDTLERLFTQNNTMRLQYLENKLAGATQDVSSISDYFLKVKSLCTEISELDSEEPISDTRLRRYVIRGLRKEFMPFISSVQGGPTQPSIIELENLLSNQEALVKQMVNQSLTQGDNILYTRDKWKGKSQQRYASNEGSSDKPEGQSRRNITCYRCGKQGHVKQDCRVKVSCNKCGKPGHIKQNCCTKFKGGEGVNFVSEAKDDGEMKWEQCFTIEVINRSGNKAAVVSQNAQVEANASIDYRKEWIIDSGCTAPKQPFCHCQKP